MVEIWKYNLLEVNVDREGAFKNIILYFYVLDELFEPMRDQPAW